MTDHPPRPAGESDEAPFDALRQAFTDDASPEIRLRLRRSLAGFREDLKRHPYVRRLDRDAERARRPRSAFWTPRRSIPAAVAALACLVLLLMLLLGKSPPTWAQVAERFRSVPSFSASIYLRGGVLGPAEPVELWVGRGGRSRIRVGDQIVFAKGGTVLRAFDLRERRRAEPDRRTLKVLEMLGDNGEFSLETAIRFLSGELVDATPTLNPQAAISGDLMVFDVQSRAGPQWLRIWALRESKLPVQIRLWDPLGREYAEAFFSYSREQPDEAFEPDPFATALSSEPCEPAHIAYAFLTDPGGRALTPEQLFRKTGYHLPAVEEAGIGGDGAIWFVAGKAQNVGVDGRPHHGFQKLEDDLGRQYFLAHDSWRLDDRSLQVFIPIEYPFDGRLPRKLTLTCEIEGLLVGKVDAVEWKRQEPPGRDESIHLRVFQARRLLGLGDRPRAEMVLSSIPGTPGESPEALVREEVRLRLAFEEKKFSEVTERGEELLPLLERRFRARKGDLEDFQPYLVALAALGKVDTARDVFRRIQESEFEFPAVARETRKRAVESEIQRRRAEFARKARFLAQELYRKTSLSTDDIARITGVDIQKDPELRELLRGDR